MWLISIHVRFRNALSPASQSHIRSDEDICKILSRDVEKVLFEILFILLFDELGSDNFILINSFLENFGSIFEKF